MDNGKDDVFAGLRELRAKASQLTGNDYYMIAQHLDALAADETLPHAVREAALASIGARIGELALEAQAAPVQAGGPDVPDIPAPPESPAQPDLVPTPEVPTAPDSPAQPDVGPGPEIPPAPDSPATPGAPPMPEVGSVTAGETPAISDVAPEPETAGASAGAPPARPPAGEDLQAAASVTPFTAPAEAEPTTTASAEGMPTGSPQREAEEEPETAAFPAPQGLAEPGIAGPAHSSGANGALPAGDTAFAFATPPAAVGMSSEPTESQATVEPATEPFFGAEAYHEEADEERTGFDELAEASWRRVEEVTRAAEPVSASQPTATDAQIAMSSPAPAAQAPSTTAPAPAELEVPASAEPEPSHAPQAAEAINDGGSESRGSGADDFVSPELVGAAHAELRPEPAGLAAAAEAEAVEPIAASPEAAPVAPAEEPASQMPFVVYSAEEAAAAEADAGPADEIRAEETTAAAAAHDAVGGETVTLPAEGPLSAIEQEPSASASAQAAPVESTVPPDAASDASATVPTLAGANLASTEAPPQPAEAEPETTLASATQAALAEAEAALAKDVETATPLSSAAKPAETASVSTEQPKSQPDPDPGKEKATRRGFFSRLFGGREGAHR